MFYDQQFVYEFDQFGQKNDTAVKIHNPIDVQLKDSKCILTLFDLVLIVDLSMSSTVVQP